MSEFVRGLSGKFIVALRKLADTKSWWQEVLADPSLIIAIRNQCFDVYWRGQSIFLVSLTGDERLVATTHPKYLLDPALSKRVSFDGRNFDTSGLREGGLI